MRTKKKRKQAEEIESKPMLTVNIQTGEFKWHGGKDYFDCINNSEQRKAYNMAAERENHMRAEFDRQLKAPKPTSKKKPNSVKLEEQYGSILRNLRKFKGLTAEQMAQQFKLDIRDVKNMLAGVSVDKRAVKEG